MDLLPIIKDRRSWRDYTSQPVTPEQIKLLIEAAVKAPASCNLQVTKFIIVDDPKLIEELGTRVSYKFRYAPATIVVIYDQRFTIDRHSVVMGTGMAVENMILQATSMGLGTCPMAGFSKDKIIKEILGIPDYFAIGLLVAVGYPNPELKLAAIPKLDLASFYTFNGFNNLSTIAHSLKLSDHSIVSIIDYRRRIAPVYLNRFRLNTYKNKYYKVAARILVEEVLPLAGDDTLYDIMSYDGKFLQTINEEHPGQLKLVATDYLQDNLDFLKEALVCQAYVISPDNKIDNLSDNTIGLASLVFQANFTPELDKLLANLAPKFKEQGLIFVTIVTESWAKRLVKLAHKLWQKLAHGRVYNIYENNPYYKIGPHRHFSAAALTNTFARHNFVYQKTGLIARSRGQKVEYYLFKRA